MGDDIVIALSFLRDNRLVFDPDISGKQRDFENLSHRWLRFSKSPSETIVNLKSRTLGTVGLDDEGAGRGNYKT